MSHFGRSVPSLRLLLYVGDQRPSAVARHDHAPKRGFLARALTIRLPVLQSPGHVALGGFIASDTRCLQASRPACRFSAMGSRKVAVSEIFEALWAWLWGEAPEGCGPAGWTARPPTGCVGSDASGAGAHDGGMAQVTNELVHHALVADGCGVPVAL